MIRFKDFAEEIFELPPDHILDKDSEFADKWEARVWNEICNSKFGYPRSEVHSVPVHEDEATQHLIKIFGQSRRRKKPGTLYLSHDIDYLHSTLQMKIKRTIAGRSLHLNSEVYLDSIKQLVVFDLNLAKKATYFISLPARSPTFTKRLKQWILDPTYEENPEYLQELVNILSRPGIEVGIHGSFYSLEDELLPIEIEKIKKTFGQEIYSSRQHWLNLPDPKANFDQMLAAGIKVDSTIGWNGNVGFRGGVTQALTFAGNNGKLKLIPMVLMDGPLFDDLKLNSTSALKKAKEILLQVWDRGGSVSIDWHDRSAHPSFAWHDTYMEIVHWAHELGFLFKNMSEAGRAR